MRKGRGKGKKRTASLDDGGSGEEEKILVNRRRGRPRKPLQNDIKEKEVEKIEEGNGDANGIVSSNDFKNQNVSENRRKRKRSEVHLDTVNEENGVESKSSTGMDDSSKSTVGCRQNGSRRKNKPRRAAEAGVECIGV